MYYNTVYAGMVAGCWYIRRIYKLEFAELIKIQYMFDI